MQKDNNFTFILTRSLRINPTGVYSHVHNLNPRLRRTPSNRSEIFVTRNSKTDAFFVISLIRYSLWF